MLRSKRLLFLLVFLASCLRMSQEERQENLIGEPSLEKSAERSLETQFFTRGDWPQANWWEAFGAEQLNGWIVEAMAKNPSIQSIRNLSGSPGASIFTIVWERRSIFYHERLGEKLTISSEQTNRFFKKLETLHVPGDPFANLNDFLDKQASMLALNDVFYLMGWILAGLLAVIFLTFLFKRQAFDLCKARYQD